MCINLPVFYISIIPLIWYQEGGRLNNGSILVLAPLYINTAF